MKDIVQLLIERSKSPDKGITFVNKLDQEDFLSYRDLFARSMDMLSFFHVKGIKRQHELIFQIDDNRDFLITFWACILGGIIPVPLTVGRTDDHKMKVFHVLSVLNNPWLTGGAEQIRKLEEFATTNGLQEQFNSTKIKTLLTENISAIGGSASIVQPKEDDIAYIQFSSGSTGSPKGVVITHRNILSNVHSIGEAAGYSSNDTILNWMPLTHDMGLIGFHINPLYNGMNQVQIPTKVFVRNPSLWLAKATEHKATILGSPNFGYNYILEHTDLDKQDWDLSKVRIIYNGAEPISNKLINRFTEAMSGFNLESTAIRPVYGLAEATLAVTISNIDKPASWLSVRRDKLMIGQTIVESEDQENSVSFVNVGSAIDCVSLRIADNSGKIFSEEKIGHIQVKGDSVTQGYYNNALATADVVTTDKWFNTGDLGFVKNGELYVTGRTKDIFFVNGQNFFPHDIERIAQDIDGMGLNKIVVGGYFDDEIQREKVLCFVLHKGSLESFVPIADNVKALVNHTVGIQFDDVVPIQSVPRTTSGKLQRFKLIQSYIDGEFADVLADMHACLNARRPGEDPEGASDNERRLLKIWKNILKRDDILVTDRFFTIGGNSLRAAELWSSVADEFGVELPLDAIYKTDTVHNLVKLIDDPKVTDFPALGRGKNAERYPVTSTQKRLYYLWRSDVSSVAYNIPVAFTIHGNLFATKLERCIRVLIARHDSLRMTFVEGETPMFEVHDNVAFSLKQTVCESQAIPEKLRSLVRPFDLQNGPLFRAELLVSKKNPVLFMDFHHIISDGISIASFVQEIFQLYSGISLQELPIRYSDYSQWQNWIDQNPVRTNDHMYWTKQMEGELPLLQLPLDFTRPAIFNPKGSRLEFELNSIDIDQLGDLAKSNNCTLHALVFTIYNVFLSKYTGQNEIVIGIPVSGRRNIRLQNVHGMFVNNLAVRVKIDPRSSFTELLKNISKVIVDALEHQAYPFEQLTSLIGRKRDVSRNPIFDTMFVYQNIGADHVGNTESGMTRFPFDPGISKFDVSLEVFDDNHSLKFSFEYATSLFRSETIHTMARRLDKLTKTIVTRPDVLIADLTFVDEHEYADRVVKFNQVETNNFFKSVTELFEDQVHADHNKIALEHDGDILSYKELNHRANVLALDLTKKGIKREKIVAVFMERSPELFVTILGTLKAGGCFLPIDPVTPDERVSDILRDSRCDLVITSNKFETRLDEIIDKLPDHPSTINIDRFESETTPVLDVMGIQNEINLSDPAYIIYTSGTTGRPKGVVIEHRSLVNYITWAAKAYVRKEPAAFPLYTSISFDLTITSIFTPLITGNKIVIYNDNLELPIRDMFRQDKVNVIKATPSHLRLALGNNYIHRNSDSVRAFIVGGEALDSALAKELSEAYGNKVEIYNEYGPTEATVGCMIHRYDPTETYSTVPIGVPIDNTRIYLLDGSLKLVANGIDGELYIGGLGLAKGYLFNQELTDERFIPDPFVKGAKMYKTGDIARWLPTGMIEYIGRSDRQVKINGYRIELNEIERMLKENPSIQEALVVVTGKNLLYAYCQPTGHDIQITESDLRTYLAGRLPLYMMPTRFIPVAQFPLTKNGKIDTSALPAAIEIKRVMKPKNEIDLILLEVWRSVFTKEEVSIYSNFFELGGDSIKAVQITSRLLECGLSVSVRNILAYQTIEQIRDRVQHVNGEQEYEQGLADGVVLPTPIINWFLSRQFSNPNWFTQSVLLDLHFQVNVRLLADAFAHIVRYHDALRLNYNGSLHYNDTITETGFSISEFTNVDTAEVCNSVRQSIRISNGLPIAAALVNNKLFITAHHLVTDGISWRILLNDLFGVYNRLVKGEDFELPPKTASFMQWSHRLAELSLDPNTLAEAGYWQTIEATDFKLPLDLPAVNCESRSMKTIHVSLSATETRTISTTARQVYNTDVSVILHTALARVLKDWTGNSEILVEVENHGRHSETMDLSRTIGWFTSMHPIRFNVPEGSIGDHIKSVKEEFKRVPNNGLGFGMLEHNDSRYRNTSPSEIRFNYLGQFDQELKNEQYSFSDESHGTESDPANAITARLEMVGMMLDGELRFDIRYSTENFLDATIESFAAGYLTELRKIASYLTNEKEVHFTPSDFEAVDLDEKELNVLFD